MCESSPELHISEFEPDFDDSINDLVQMGLLKLHSDQYLPIPSPKIVFKTKKKLLFLDMDETLLHAATT